MVVCSVVVGRHCGCCFSVELMFEFISLCFFFFLFQLFVMLASFLQLLDKTIKKVSAKEERRLKMAKAKAKKDARRKAKEEAKAKRG